LAKDIGPKWGLPRRRATWHFPATLAVAIYEANLNTYSLPSARNLIIVADLQHGACYRSHMQQYRVTFGDRDGGEATGLSFRAGNLRDALAYLADHHTRQPLELWREDQFLGRLEFLQGEDGSFWRLG
jgi:hypothetical protein